ncbi:MAG: Coenzyme F420 hydrogenase/dehydrogenase, beta subunit C-terminal domain [Candidatus Krumholzibacteriales bacterium]
MSAELPVDILFRRVIERGLCTRCGTCAGVCPTGNIYISDYLGNCLPARRDRCNSCGLCLKSCPGERVEFQPMESKLFGDRDSHPMLGVVRKAYLAYAAESDVRQEGASGGVATAIQLHLLREGEISGSLLYSPLENLPLRGQGALVEDESSIRASAQSRYHLSPMNTALAEISKRNGRYAFVGLPCHIHGLMKALDAGWSCRAEIDPVIGIYCGNNLFFEATGAMLRKLGVDDLGEVVSLSYREGDWPGNFAVTLKSEETLRIPKLDFNQAIPFYINHRCLTCIDLANELADISVGDGWAREEDSEKGWSIVLARSERGVEIVSAASNAGAIHLEEISMQDAADMHSHGFDLKKRGAFIRLKIWKGWGRAVPEYDREPPPVKTGRKIVELFVSLQFIICSSRPGRAAFRILPLKAAGVVFRALRKLWMKKSKQ